MDFTIDRLHVFCKKLFSQKPLYFSLVITSSTRFTILLTMMND